MLIKGVKMHDKFKSCKGCPDRVAIPNCHSTCEGYLARRKEMDETNKEIHKARNEESDMIGYFRDKGERIKKMNKGRY